MWIILLFCGFNLSYTKCPNICLLFTRNIAHATLLTQIIKLQNQLLYYLIKTICLDSIGKFRSQTFDEYCIFYGIVFNI